MKTTMADRCRHITSARAYLAEAARRRTHAQSGNFYWRLLAWARAARLRAAAAGRHPQQGGLFA